MASEAGPRSALARRIRRAGSERGSATETAIVFPVALIAIFTVIQFGLAFHAQHVALAVAQEGARAARLYQASDADGMARANQALAALNGGGILADPRISINRSGNESVRVAVSGHVLSLVPGLDLAIRPQVVQGPVERFRGVQGG
jgi:Flp pilus assembly protein TadG